MFNQQAKTSGQKALADQGRQVKQTAVNFRGTAPPPVAPPSPTAPGGGGMAPAPQQARDRPFSQSQAAYQRGGMMTPTLSTLAKRPNSSTGNFGTHDSTGLGKTQGRYVRPAVDSFIARSGAGADGNATANAAPTNSLDALGYGQRADGSGGPGYGGTVASAAPAGQAGATDYIPWLMGGTGGTSASNAPGNGTFSPFPGTYAPPAFPGNSGSPGGIPVGQDPFSTLVGQVGGPLGNVAKTMSAADDASYRKHQAGVYSGLDEQDALARGQYGSPARAAAEAAARQEMQLGIDSQRMAQNRSLIAGAGRGGAVSQGQGNAINNSAAMAQQAGERGLTMDAAERQRQASQDLLNAIQGTTDRRKELGDETYTSRKDFLALGAKMISPMGFFMGNTA